MKTSQRGIDLIKKYEGFKPAEYLCPAGKRTIGYGHLIRDGECFSLPLSEPEAETILRQDVSGAEAAVKRRVKVPLKQCEFDALVSFTFNLGEGNLKESGLLKKINTTANKKAAGEFGRWIFADGEPLPGLIKRRAEEALMFIGH